MNKTICILCPLLLVLEMGLLGLLINWKLLERHAGKYSTSEDYDKSADKYLQQLSHKSSKEKWINLLRNQRDHHIHSLAVSENTTASIQVVTQDLMGLTFEISKTEKALKLSNVQTKFERDFRIINFCSNEVIQRVFSESYLCNCKLMLVIVAKVTFKQIVSGEIHAFHSNNCSTFRETIHNDAAFFSAPCIPLLSKHTKQSVVSEIYYDLKTSYHTHSRDKNYKLPAKNSKITVDYMHVIKDAYVSPLGGLITGQSIWLCKYQEVPVLHTQVQQYDRVFVISEYAGFAYYHFLIQNLARMAVSLPFLIRNKDVKVHVRSTKPFVIDYLRELGIATDRLVNGYIRAKTVYFPSSSDPDSIFPVNALSIFLRKPVIEYAWNSIVLIKRSHIRWFNNHDSIFEMLKTVGKQYRLKVEVFRDDPPPNVQKTRDIFHQALMVVAPHGAGLTNMLFCRKHTCIIEALCYREIEKPWYFPTMYKTLAASLGHIYYGIVPAPHHKSCMETRPESLQPIVEHCLETLKEMN